MSKATQELIRKKCNELADLLVSKNESYGDSAFEPVSVFSSARLDPAQLLLIRMDDKIARIRNGKAYELGEDSYWDLAGYLILYLVLRDMRRANTTGSDNQWPPPKPPLEPIVEGSDAEEPPASERQGWNT